MLQKKQKWGRIGTLALLALVWIAMEWRDVLPTNELVLTDIYVSVSENFSIAELSMYDKWADEVRHATDAKIGEDGTFHFAVGYHPETSFIIKGEGVESYSFHFEEDELRVDLYLDEMGVIHPVVL